MTPHLTPGQGKRSKFDPVFLLHIRIALSMEHQAQIVKPEFDPRSRSKFDPAFLLQIWIAVGIEHHAPVAKPEVAPI